MEKQHHLLYYYDKYLEVLVSIQLIEFYRFVIWLFQRKTFNYYQS